MGLLIYNGIKPTPEIGDIVITTKLRDPDNYPLFPRGTICKVVGTGYSKNWKCTKYRLVRVDNDFDYWWYTADMFESY